MGVLEAGHSILELMRLLIKTVVRGICFCDCRGCGPPIQCPLHFLANKIDPQTIHRGQGPIQNHKPYYIHYFFFFFVPNLHNSLKVV